MDEAKAKKREQEDADLFSKDNLGPWERYTQEMSKGRAYPINEYEHAAYMVDSTQEKLTEFSQLVDRAVQLANISDDYLMRLEQTSAALLVNFFDMAQREPGLQSFFLIRYHEWRSEILLTKAKDGSERGLQAAVGTKYTPTSRSASGYGSQLDLMNQGQENEDLSFLKNIFPKRRK